jgi:hypothetical protein
MAGGISHRHDRVVSSYFTLPWAAGDGSTGGEAPAMAQASNFVPLDETQLNNRQIDKVEQAPSA